MVTMPHDCLRGLAAHVETRGRQETAVDISVSTACLLKSFMKFVREIWEISIEIPYILAKMGRCIMLRMHINLQNCACAEFILLELCTLGNA